MSRLFVFWQPLKLKGLIKWKLFACLARLSGTLLIADTEVVAQAGVARGERSRGKQRVGRGGSSSSSGSDGSENGSRSGTMSFSPSFVDNNENFCCTICDTIYLSANSAFVLSCSGEGP